MPELARTAMLGCELQMRLSRVVTGILLIVVFGALGVCQNTPQQEPQTSETRAPETKGMPPRSSPTDYQAHAQAGTVTIAAEFTGHSVPRPEGPLSTENYIVVETCLFGAAGGPVRVAVDDFSLRINGKKAPLPSVPFGMVLSSLRDPQWTPPEQAGAKTKSKGGLTTGGGQSDPGTPPPVIHIPIEMQRAMAQYVQKASLPEGDRTLPEAGLLFFQYRGKEKSIHSLELIYAGPTGKATLELQP